MRNSSSSPLLPVCCFLFTFFLPRAHSDLVHDTTALLTLKASWEDLDRNLSSWIISNSSSPCGSWEGVTCNSANTTVIGLSLSKLRLHGTLSYAIGNLTSLQTLTLVETSLYGPLPTQMSALSALAILDLSGNSLSGPLPDTIISNLTSLSKVCLDYNNFSGPIPSAPWARLPYLRTLRLRSNSFAGTLPDAIFAPGSPIKQLLLDFNFISGEIPQSIGSMTRLAYFSAVNNSLTGQIPDSITRLPKLNAIYLAFNGLNGSIPRPIGGLKGLVYLDLSSNRLAGSLPEDLGSLPSLKLLNLSNNHFDGSIPLSLSNLSSLVKLGLSNNNLSGEVPTGGVLGSFSNASFAGNPDLCGGPLARKCTFAPPPLSVPTPPPPPPFPLSPPNTPVSTPNSSLDATNRVKIIASSVAGALGLCIVVTIIVLALFLRRRAKREDVQIQTQASPDFYTPASNSASDNVNPAKLEMFVRAFRYSYDEVVSHAGYYDTAHVVGKGRFATVFRSDLPNRVQLAVKVFKNPISQQAFEKEIVGLETVAGQFYTLLPIRGFYANSTEKVIFYNFMPKGTLYTLLHGNSGDTAAAPLLDWTKRLHIGIGIAQAIVHLHRGSSIRILHKDLKSSNVLLDDKFLPLVADYGLIGLVSEGLYVETPGYTAPELKASKKYTEKTDVYSFGVVLLELLTGKKPVSYIGNRELNLVTWVTRLWKDGRGKEVLFSHLVESCPFPDYYPERALGLAVECLSEHPAQRPSMSEISSILEGLTDAHSPMRSPGLRPERPLLL